MMQFNHILNNNQDESVEIIKLNVFILQIITFFYSMVPVK